MQINSVVVDLKEAIKLKKDIILHTKYPQYKKQIKFSEAHYNELITYWSTVATVKEVINHRVDIIT